MADAALVALAFACSYLGLALLALSQRPHHASVEGSSSRAALPRAARRRYLGLGTAALAASFGVSLAAEGSSFGSLLWVLGLSGTGLGVMFTLSFRPRWLRPLRRALG